MSVLKGEGRVPILFGTASIPAGPLIHTAYLSRPDLTGEWPTIVVVPSIWGLTSSTKDIARRLARQGFAVLVPALYRADPPSRSGSADEASVAYASLGSAAVEAVLDDVAGFITNPSGFWSSAERGFGLLGLGAGAAHALRAAASGMGVALAVVGASAVLTSTGDEIVELGRALTCPLLVVASRRDPEETAGGVLGLREAAPHGEFALYEGVADDFIDDYSESYDPMAAADALERLAAFFLKELPPGPG